MYHLPIVRTLIIALSIHCGQYNNAHADTFITTEDGTVVITNRPTRKQRSKGKRVGGGKRTKGKTCYLEDKRTGEMSLTTSPTRQQLRSSRIIWCKGEDKPQAKTSSSPAPRRSRKTKGTSKKRSLPKRADRFRPFVEGAAVQYKLPEALLWAFMKVESDFIPTAVSRVGAQGLMQLMPFTARDMGVEDPFDPEQNIYGAAKLISILMKRFHGELPLVISAYHAGGGAVTKKEGIPYAATSQYMTAVLNAYYRFMEAPPYQRSSSKDDSKTETKATLSP